MKPLPRVTALLVLANLVAYALELEGGGVEAVCAAHGLVPAAFVAHGAVLPILTSMFLHAGLAHLLGNLLTLAVAGAVVERELGSTRFLGLYLAAGVLGGLMHVLVDPAAVDPLVGASGAIFGVLAVLGAVRPRTLGFVGGFVAFNVWLAFGGSGGGDVSFGTHLGGFATGALFALVQKFSAREALAS